MAMRPEQSDPARLWDIVQWGRRLERLLRDVCWDDYRRNEEKQIAVERCLEVIGEAANHLSESFRHRHEQIPWRAIVQQRNIIAHGYFRLEHERLWEVATVHVPDLVTQLQGLIDADEIAADDLEA